MTQFSDIDVPFSYEHVETRTNDDNLPEQVWIVANLEVILSLDTTEKDQEGYIMLNAGDWEIEKYVACKDFEDLARQAIEFVSKLAKE